MNQQQFRERVQTLITEEMSQPEGWFYLSFVDDTGFLGIIVVKAHGPTTALKRAHELQINPGGQVMAVRLPDDYHSHMLQPIEEVGDRLLSREEAEAAFGELKRSGGE